MFQIWQTSYFFEKIQSFKFSTSGEILRRLFNYKYEYVCIIFSMTWYIYKIFRISCWFSLKIFIINIYKDAKYYKYSFLPDFNFIDICPSITVIPESKCTETTGSNYISLWIFFWWSAKVEFCSKSAIAYFFAVSGYFYS